MEVYISTSIIVRYIIAKYFWMKSSEGDFSLNEIIWAYDYGGRARSKWPAKHDNILFYVKDPKKLHLNVDEIDREPYMAPGLVGTEKAEKGKLPTDTWWPRLCRHQRLVAVRHMVASLSQRDKTIHGGKQ